MGDDINMSYNCICNLPVPLNNDYATYKAILDNLQNYLNSTIYLISLIYTLKPSERDLSGYSIAKLVNPMNYHTILDILLISENDKLKIRVNSMQIDSDNPVTNYSFDIYTKIVYIDGGEETFDSNVLNTTDTTKVYHIRLKDVLSLSLDIKEINNPTRHNYLTLYWGVEYH